MHPNDVLFQALCSRWKTPKLNEFRELVSLYPETAQRVIDVLAAYDQEDAPRTRFEDLPASFSLLEELSGLDPAEERRTECTALLERVVSESVEKSEI